MTATPAEQPKNSNPANATSSSPPTCSERERRRERERERERERRFTFSKSPPNSVQALSPSSVPPSFTRIDKEVTSWARRKLPVCAQCQHRTNWAWSSSRARRKLPLRAFPQYRTTERGVRPEHDVKIAIQGLVTEGGYSDLHPALTR